MMLSKLVKVVNEKDFSNEQFGLLVKLVQVIVPKYNSIKLSTSHQQAWVHLLPCLLLSNKCKNIQR